MRCRALWLESLRSIMDSKICRTLIDQSIVRAKPDQMPGSGTEVAPK